RQSFALFQPADVYTSTGRGIGLTGAASRCVVPLGLLQGRLKGEGLLARDRGNVALRLILVLDDERPEDLFALAVVLGACLSIDGEFAASTGFERVGVFIMPKPEGPGHAITIRNVAVFGIRDGHAEVDRVGTGEDETGADIYTQLRCGITNGDRLHGKTNATLRVCCVKDGGELAELVIRVGDLNAFGVNLTISVEIPRVGDLIVVEVDRIGGIEGHLEGCQIGRASCRGMG